MTLCIDQIDADSLCLRQRIEESLQRLEKETLIKRNGDNYFFLTNEERDINREIKAVDLNSGEEAKLLGEIIFDEVLKGKRKHRFVGNKKDFPLNRFCDKHPIDRHVENGLVLSVITPLLDEHDIYNPQKCTLESGMEGGQVIIRLNDHKSLVRELRTYLKTEKYVSRKSNGDVESATARILRDFTADNRDRRNRLMELLCNLLIEAHCFAVG